jgi:hypothetical protein
MLKCIVVGKKAAKKDWLVECFDEDDSWSLVEKDGPGVYKFIMGLSGSGNKRR